MKIAMPVRFPGGTLLVVEDDTPEAVQASIACTVRCSPEDRLARPEFGTVIPLFDPATTDVVDVVVEQVREWVPTAEHADVAAELAKVPA